MVSDVLSPSVSNINEDIILMDLVDRSIDALNETIRSSNQETQMSSLDKESKFYMIHPVIFSV